MGKKERKTPSLPTQEGGPTTTTPGVAEAGKAAPTDASAPKITATRKRRVATIAAQSPPKKNAPYSVLLFEEGREEEEEEE